MSEPVRAIRNGAILEVTLDRPKANAIDVATSRALYAAFRDFQEDASLSVAMLTGGGERFFSAGWDLKAAAGGEEVEADHGPGGFAGLTEFFDLDKPVIAVVNGIAFGGGFEVALACDLIIASETARFALPEVTLGIIANAGGVQRLPRLLPRAIAMELLLTGRSMDAAEARSLGIVNRVVAPAQLMSEARAVATMIAANAPLALRAVKALARAGEALPVAGSFAVMRSRQIAPYEAMVRSRDAVEGVRAFVEKRAPIWEGR
jgi:crotonobetainyl-CoA hydratase